MVADELHLLRIVDVLVRNLVDEARDKDELQGISDPLRGPALMGLIRAIKSCGVRFQIWAKLNQLTSKLPSSTSLSLLLNTTQ